MYPDIVGDPLQSNGFAQIHDNRARRSTMRNKLVGTSVFTDDIHDRTAWFCFDMVIGKCMHHLPCPLHIQAHEGPEPVGRVVEPG